MTRTTLMLALLALLSFPAGALAQEQAEPAAAPEAAEPEAAEPEAAEPTQPQAPEPAEAAEPEPLPARPAPNVQRLVRPRLVVPVPVIPAAAPEPVEPAGDPSEVIPAQAIEPSEEDAFPADPVADEAMQQALDDGFGDELGDEGFGQPPLGDEVFEEPAEPDHAEPAGELAAAGEEAEHGDSQEAGAPHEEEHGEAHGPNYPAMILNFLIWGAIIVWLLKKPLTSFLKNRRVAVIEGLEESKRIKAEAEAKHAEYTERLAHLDEELAQLRTEMIQAGEAERDRIIAEAESRAARMRRDAQFVVDQQMKQLKADLTREAIEAAVKAAEEVLTAQTGAADQERLAKAYLGDVASSMNDKVQA